MDVDLSLPSDLLNQSPVLIHSAVWHALADARLLVEHWHRYLSLRIGAGGRKECRELEVSGLGFWPHAHAIDKSLSFVPTSKLSVTACL